MIDRSTVQELQNTVAAMGREKVCRQPHAFAGAILDTCDSGEVKLLTTALRSPYGPKLMSFFLDGSGDAATWTQQKSFLIDESGMSVENAENMLDALWQAMGWQRPKPSRPDPEPVKKVVTPKAEPDDRVEEVGRDRSETHRVGLLKRVPDPPSRDKKAPKGSAANPVKLKANSAQARQASLLKGEKIVHKKAPAWVIKGDVLVDEATGEYYVIDTFDDSSLLDDVLMIPGIIGALYFGFRIMNGSADAVWTKYALIISILVYVIGGVIDYCLIQSYEREAMRHRE